MMNKKLIFLFVFFLGFLSFPGAGSARESLIANHYVQEGKKLFEKKDYDLAIVEFHKALLADPQHEEALMYLRMLGFGGGDKRDIVKTREQKQDLPALDKNTEPQKNVSKSTSKKVVEPPKDLSTPAVENQVIDEQKSSAQALQAQSPQKAKKSCRVKKEASKKKVKKRKVKKSPMSACELKAKTSPAKEVSKTEKPQIAKEAEKEAESVSPVAVEPQNTPQKFSKKPMSPVAQKPLESLASGEEKTGLPKLIDKETPDERARIHQEFSREKLDKMRKAHAKYSRKPMGKNQKAVFKDVNGDGVKERISLAEKKELEKIEAQIDKKEKAALKNLEKKSAQKEKPAFKNIPAHKASGRKAGFFEYKAGDVVSSSDAGQSEDLAEIKKDNLARDGNAKRKKSLPENPENVVKQDALKTQPIDLPVDGDDQAPAPQKNMKTVVSKKDVQSERDLAKPQVAVNQDELAPGGDLAKPQVAVNQDERLSDTDTSDVVKNNSDEVLVEEPNSAVKETVVDQGALLDKQDLAQKEKEIYKKAQAKKAAVILEAQKVSLEKAAKPAEMPDVVDKDGQSFSSSAKQQDFSTAAFSQAVEQKVKPVAKENTVLKKKLGEVIEIAQQDQKTIQELEENAKAQSDKVEVLENDLVETKQALETKK